MALLGKYRENGLYNVLIDIFRQFNNLAKWHHKTGWFVSLKKWSLEKPALDLTSPPLASLRRQILPRCKRRRKRRKVEPPAWVWQLRRAELDQPCPAAHLCRLLRPPLQLGWKSHDTPGRKGSQDKWMWVSSPHSSRSRDTQATLCTRYPGPHTHLLSLILTESPGGRSDRTPRTEELQGPCAQSTQLAGGRDQWGTQESLTSQLSC